MRKGLGIVLASAAALLLAACAQGAGRDGAGGESIGRKETESDVYGEAVRQGAKCGVLQALEGENEEAARSLALQCMVRVDVTDGEEIYYGSGVIWDKIDGRPVIVTAGHLLEKGEVLRIVFADGSSCTGSFLGTAAAADAGFIAAEGGENWPAASLHQRIFDTLDEYSILFVMAGSQDGVGDVVRDAVLEERAWYREEFGSDVMLIRCRSGQGMSGGGVFDGYGHLAGMVVGGSEDKTAALSMETLNGAYEEVCGKSRDTQAYSRDGM